LRPAGYPCKTNPQCSSNVCTGGSCTSNLNYGALCVNLNATCPSDATCNNNGTTTTCTKIVGLNQPCNSNVICGNFMYCDTTSNPNTCKLQSQSTAGQSCAVSPSQCTTSTYCNTTSMTCVSASAINNTACDSISNICPGPYLCLCNGNNPQCSQYENYNCDSQASAAITCAANNCPAQPIITIDSQSCAIQNCSAQAAAYYCCVLNFNSQYAQYLNNAVGSFFNCNKNTFVPSPCVTPASSSKHHSSSKAHHSSEKSSGTNLQISLYALFSTILFVFGFL